MRLFTLTSRVWLPRPLSEVFPFFADAHNLEVLTPPWLRFEVLTPEPIPMRAGTLIDYRLRLRGLPIRWQSEISAWQPPHRFVDEQRKGPYRIWIHEHRFSEHDGSTLVEDFVRYAVYGGTLVNRVFVARDLHQIFEHRRAKMQEVFGRLPGDSIPSQRTSLSQELVAAANGNAFATAGRLRGRE